MTLTAADLHARQRTDEELAADHAAGDSSAFDLLFERYRGRVYGYARRMLGRAEEADEVTAQTFVRILEGRYRPVGRFRSYLFAVAHRACLERLRRRRTADKYLPWLRIAAPSRTPEEVAVLGDDQRRMDRAIATLPEEHRTVLLLYYGQELASREVAAIVGCTDQQIRSKLAYARRKLREAMEVGDGAP